MVARGNHFVCDAGEVEVGLGDNRSVSLLCACVQHCSYLPLQTSRVEAWSSILRVLLRCEDMQYMVALVFRCSQWKLVLIVLDQRELVEDALERSWDAEDAALLLLGP
jgi:hypothetical protein